MGNFDTLEMILSATCGENNELITDDTGMPSVMVKIPKFNMSDIWTGETGVFPAFVTDERDVQHPRSEQHIYVSKYMNTVYNDRAYSIPGQDYAEEFSEKTALQLCLNKGKCAMNTTWHMMTRLEWMALALLAKKNGTLPYGNNDYGKDFRESSYRAIPLTYDEINRVCHVAGGSGPLTWSHDHTAAGVWDLNGNGWEMMYGIRFVYGELQLLSHVPESSDYSIALNNTAAIYQDVTPVIGETGKLSWCAIDGTTGNLIPIVAEDGNTSNCLRLDYRNGYLTWTTGSLQNKSSVLREQSIALIKSADNEEAPTNKALTVLRTLGLYGDYDGKLFFVNNRIVHLSCGGSFVAEDAAGSVFSVSAILSDSMGFEGESFRAAYISE